MGHVVVKLEVVVDNGVIRMVELEEVLQRSCSLFVSCLDIVDLDRFQVDCCPGVASQEAGHTERIGERGER